MKLEAVLALVEEKSPLDARRGITLSPRRAPRDHTPPSAPVEAAAPLGARGSRARRWLLTFQNWGLGWYGYSLPVFCGNLPFTNVGFGLQPISEAVHIVTGAPIPHDGVAGPVTDARVDAMHTRYVAALRALFDAHKGAYAPGRELLIK